MSEQPVKRPVGRPTEYRPEYCDLVIQAGRDGKSLTNFAADLEVSRQTVNNWVDQFPEFLDAVTRAKALMASWYEIAQRNVVQNGGTSAQSSLIQFGLKNLDPDGWKEKQEVAHSGGVNITITPDDDNL